MAEPELEAEATRLTPGIQQFIESVGLYFEQYDLPRIGGRMLGLLMVASRPLSLDDMATLLRVSRASVSTNARMTVDYGLVEQVSFPGDRRDYYRYRDDAWERAMVINIEATAALRKLGEQGLSAISPDNPVGRARLADLRDFCEFSLTEQYASLERWRTLRRSRETR